MSLVWLGDHPTTASEPLGPGAVADAFASQTRRVLTGIGFLAALGVAATALVAAVADPDPEQLPDRPAQVTIQVSAAAVPGELPDMLGEVAP